MKRSTLVTLLLAAGFVALLLYSTLSAQQVECEACVTFNGRTNCASASAKDEQDALLSAVNTACGTLTGTMDERIRCANLAPERPRCARR